MDWLTPMATVLAAYFGARWGLKNYIGQQWWQERKSYYAKLLSKINSLREQSDLLYKDVYFYTKSDPQPDEDFNGRCISIINEIETTRRELFSLYGEAFPYLNQNASTILSEGCLLMSKYTIRLLGLFSPENNIDSHETLDIFEKYMKDITVLRLGIHREMEIELSLTSLAGLIKMKRITKSFFEEYEKSKSKRKKS